MSPSSSSSSTSPDFEIVFLGTGTSSSLPQIECLTAPPDSDKPPCHTCLSTLHPQGRKNIRRNTSAVIRAAGKDGTSRTIVIDVGKNFQAAALEWFPKYGLRKIDALLITHAHADAMNGLDDLRGWTLRGAIQSHIDVYVSMDTFTEVKRSFPYLVSKEFASGGGDVPQFKWHIIEDQVPFEVRDTGIMVTPFAVHHGRLFSNPTTAVRQVNSLDLAQGTSGTPSDEVANVTEEVCPYLSFGFRIQDRLLYISDFSHIPENVWPLLEQGKSPRASVAVLDCLRLCPHTSHVGLEDSVKMAWRINATRTYLTGFGHEVSHDEYVRLGEVIGGARYEASDLTEREKRGLELIGNERGLWVRPSHDGLRVWINEEGGVMDESYQ